MSATEATESDEVNARLLIRNRQVGYIIGKKGERITQVRDQCGIFMSILKSDSRIAQERILALRGTIENIAKGVQQVSDLILQGISGKNSNADTLAMCFLVHKFIVGSIIGKSGEMIKGIQTDTDAKIQISTDPLPNSTEKTVTVTGTPVAIHEATIRILTQLKANPLRAGTKAIRYKPGQQPQFGVSPFMTTQQQPFYGMPPVYNAATSTTQINTQKIAIPTVCAGSVIGRNGSVIRDIKARTGCNISIQDAENDTPNDRVVVLVGTTQGIQQAIFMISHIVEQYKPPAGQY